MNEQEARELAGRIGRDYGWAHTGGGIWTAQREDDDGSVIWNVSVSGPTLLMSVETYVGPDLIRGINFAGPVSDHIAAQVAATEEWWETSGTAFPWERDEMPLALPVDSEY